MTLLFLAIIAGLLAFIAHLLAESLRLQRAVVRAIAPRKFDPLDWLTGENREPRTIIDQLGELHAHIDGRLARMEGALAYLRSYTWETQDTRYIEDIRKPPKSDEWGRSFGPHGDPDDFGLWMREQDMSEGFERAVRGSYSDPADDEDEGDDDDGGDDDETP